MASPCSTLSKLGRVAAVEDLEGRTKAGKDVRMEDITSVDLGLKSLSVFELTNPKTLEVLGKWTSFGVWRS